MVNHGQMNQMTRKEAVDLMAYFTLVSVSKQGDALVEKYVSQAQIDKMMRTIVSLFKGDNKKAETFILDQIQRLLRKLDKHNDLEAKESTFIKGDKEQ